MRPWNSSGPWRTAPAPLSRGNTSQTSRSLSLVILRGPSLKADDRAWDDAPTPESSILAHWEDAKSRYKYFTELNHSYSQVYFLAKVKLLPKRETKLYYRINRTLSLFFKINSDIYYIFFKCISSFIFNWPYIAYANITVYNSLGLFLPYLSVCNTRSSFENSSIRLLFSLLFFSFQIKGKCDLISHTRTFAITKHQWIGKSVGITF